MTHRTTIAMLLPPPRPCLEGRVLHLLAQGVTLTRIEAERLAGAHALPSTIAELRWRRGLGDFITATPREVLGLHGSRARMAAYSLTPEPAALNQAFRLLWSWGWRGEGIDPPPADDTARAEDQPDLFADLPGIGSGAACGPSGGAWGGS